MPSNVKIKINYTYCKRCGICYAFCLPKVFNLTEDGSPEVNFLERCTACRLCDIRCPEFAINVEVC